MQIIEKVVNYDPAEIEKRCAQRAEELGLDRLRKEQRRNHVLGDACFFGALGVVVLAVNYLVKYTDVVRFLLFAASLALFTMVMVKVLGRHDTLLRQEMDLKESLKTPASAYHEAVKNRDVVVCFGRMNEKNDFELTLITRGKEKEKPLFECKITFACAFSAQEGDLVLDVGNEVIRCTRAVF